MSVGIQPKEAILSFSFSLGPSVKRDEVPSLLLRFADSMEVRGLMEPRKHKGVCLDKRRCLDLTVPGEPEETTEYFLAPSADSEPLFLIKEKERERCVHRYEAVPQVSHDNKPNWKLV